ncbi:hypothetical protein [Planococcus koreensis]|uniref:hypothetical protein n=1 Tax=Planococcus koreensis TaxID=112331 RepID=UPI0039FCB5E2
MRLAMIQNGQAEQAAIISGGKAATVAAVNKTYNENWQTDIFGLIESGELDGLTRWFNETGKAAIERGELPAEDAASLLYGPLYRRPRKIWASASTTLTMRQTWVKKRQTLNRRAS